MGEKVKSKFGQATALKRSERLTKARNKKSNEMRWKAKKVSNGNDNGKALSLVSGSTKLIT